MMSTPTTTPSNRELVSGELSERVERASSSIKRAGRALAHDFNDTSAATVRRDAIAHGVMRLAVLALEIVAIALIIAGGLGAVQQFGAAESFGPSLWLPILAILVVTGLGALFALALAASLVTILRISADVDAMKSSVGVVGRRQAEPGVGNGRAAA